MHSNRPRLIALAILVIIPLSWLVWWLRAGALNVDHAVLMHDLPTLRPTAETGLSTIAPKHTADTNRPAPANAATVPATWTPEAALDAAMPVATAVPSTPAITPSRLVAALPPPALRATISGPACPEPPPLKPAYDRYVLSGKKWPVADSTGPQAHFWLDWPVPASDGRFLNQTYPYGSDGSGRYLLHNGIDMAEPRGTPLLAVGDGTVLLARSDAREWFGWRCDWYGQLVVLELDQTWLGQPIYALYGHVLNITVDEGQRVRRGDQVAEVGLGGAALVPHLHFEVRVGTNEFSSTRNPILWMSPSEGRGVVAGRLLDPEGRPWHGVVVSLVGRDVQGATTITNTWSYLDDPMHLANPDETLAENFVIGNVPPGEYVLYTKLQGIEYRVEAPVEAGQLTLVTIETEPLKTATPGPGNEVAGSE